MGDHLCGGDRADAQALLERSSLRLAGEEAGREQVAGPGGVDQLRDRLGVDVAAEPVSQVIDTTGAGDLFAAGFLFGHTRGRSNQESLRIGAIAASEVISHYGARPETDLKELVAESLA